MKNSQLPLLIAGIFDIVDGLYGSASIANAKRADSQTGNADIERTADLSDTSPLGYPGDPAEESSEDSPRLQPDRSLLLRQRLLPLLDKFLMESEPIVNTKVTILLADIRGFTALTRSLPPQKLISLLNRYFTIMSRIVEQHGGMIDKFMGDSIMALFGALEPKPDDLQRALTCAVQMQLAMAKLNQKSLQRGEPRLYAGIAVNTGQVMAGSFGSKYHREYTVIGDAVNLVSRIEYFSLRGQVLLSESSRMAAGSFIEVGCVNRVHVKGVVGPIALYELRSVNSPHRLVIPRVDVRTAPRITVDLNAIFRQVEAKQVRQDEFIGRVRDMSYYGMCADLPMGLPAHSEVVLNLRTEDMPAPGTDQDVYARILRAEPSGSSFRTSLEFTTIDTPGHRRVKRYVDDQLWRR